MRQLLLTLCLVLACGTAYSGEKEHRAMAEELIKITGGDKIMDSMKGQLEMVFRQISDQMNIQEADKPKLEKYTKRFHDILNEDLAWAKSRDKYLDLYTATFTEKELKTLVDFYKSDLGKKVTEKMPELMQQSMMVARTHMDAVIPKLETLTEEMRKEFEPSAASPAGEDSKDAADKENSKKK